MFPMVVIASFRPFPLKVPDKEQTRSELPNQIFCSIKRTPYGTTNFSLKSVPKTHLINLILDLSQKIPKEFAKL
jgi:hypothetical protein